MTPHIHMTILDFIQGDGEVARQGPHRLYYACIYGSQLAHARNDPIWYYEFTRPGRHIVFSDVPRPETL